MSRMHEPTFAEIINKSTELFKNNFKALIIVSIIAAVIQQLCQVYLLQLGLNKVLEVASEKGMQAVQDTIPSSTMLTIGLVFIVVGLVELITCSMYVIYANESWQDKKTSILSSLQSVLKVLPVLIVTTILIKFVCGIFLMGILFFVGILLYALFLVYMPVVLLEKKGIFQSLKQSVNLSKQAYFKCVGITLFTFIALMIPSIASMLLNQSGGLGFGIEQVVAIFLSALMYPWVSIIILGQYYALKAKQANQNEI